MPMYEVKTSLRLGGKRVPVGEIVELSSRDGEELEVIHAVAARPDLDEAPPLKALAKMAKVELLAVAADKAVTSVRRGDGSEIAIADATNAEIITAIEAA